MSFNMNSYQKNYKKNNYERISLEVKKGSKEKIKNYAKMKDMKLNEYIKHLINKDSGIDV